MRSAKSPIAGPTPRSGIWLTLRLRLASALAMALILAGSNPAHAACTPEDLTSSAEPVPDEVAIANLKAEFHRRLELREWESWGCLFQHGALLDAAGKVVARGADEATAFMQTFLGKAPRDLLVRRMTSNPLIEVDPGGRTASGEWNDTVLRVRPGDSQPQFFRLAYFHDRFQKIGDRWWFLTSRETTQWLAPAEAEAPQPSP